MRKQIAAANWKMNLTYQEAENLLEKIAGGFADFQTKATLAKRAESLLSANGFERHVLFAALEACDHGLRYAQTFCYLILGQLRGDAAAVHEFGCVATSTHCIVSFTRPLAHAGAKGAALLGAFDHGKCHSIFIRRRRIERLQLDHDISRACVRGRV